MGGGGKSPRGKMVETSSPPQFPLAEPAFSYGIPGRLMARHTVVIEVVRLQRDQVLQFIALGKIYNAKSIAALLVYLYKSV